MRLHPGAEPGASPSYRGSYRGGHEVPWSRAPTIVIGTNPHPQRAPIRMVEGLPGPGHEEQGGPGVWRHGRMRGSLGRFHLYGVGGELRTTQGCGRTKVEDNPRWAVSTSSDQGVLQTHAHLANTPCWNELRIVSFMSAAGIVSIGNSARLCPLR